MATPPPGWSATWQISPPSACCAPASTTWAPEYLTFIDALPEAQDHGTPLGEARFELTAGLTIQIRCSRLDQFLFIRLTAEGPEAQSLNARWQGWAYQVGIWKEKAFLPTLEELTQSP